MILKNFEIWQAGKATETNAQSNQCKKKKLSEMNPSLFARF